MRNKLFLVCPNSQLHHFIEDKYGKHVFFLTALGSVFNFEELDFVEAVVSFIRQEKIREIYIVHDTSCAFIRSVLAKENGYKTYAESVLVDLLIDNYFSVMHSSATLVDKQISLAELNIRRQARELLENEQFVQLFREGNLTLHGLVTTKSEDVAIEVEAFASCVA